MGICRPRAIALALSAATLLAGCESLSDPTPPPEAAPAQPTPRPVSGDTYTTVLPPDWSNRLGDQSAVLEYSSGGTPILLVKHAPSGPVKANVNDVVSNVVVVRLRDQMPDTKVVNYVKTFPGTTLTAPPRHYDLGGDEGVMVAYTQISNGTPVETLDMVVSHHGLTHEVFFTAAVPSFNAQLHDAMEIIDSWSWKDGA